MTRRIQNAYVAPWIHAALNASSALIPNPHVDDLGVSIPKPFSDHFFFLNDFFQIHPDASGANLHVKDTFVCHTPEAHNLTCNSANRTIFAHISEDQGLLLAWGTSQKSNLLHLPEIKRLNIGASEQKNVPALYHSLSAIDHAATSALVHVFPGAQPMPRLIHTPSPCAIKTTSVNCPSCSAKIQTSLSPTSTRTPIITFTNAPTPQHPLCSPPSFTIWASRQGGKVLVFKHRNPRLELNNP